jgi:hypothetical protein
MYGIHYVISRENDIRGHNLSSAIAYARSRIKATNSAILTDPRAKAVGFSDELR